MLAMPPRFARPFQTCACKWMQTRRSLWSRPKRSSLSMICICCSSNSRCSKTTSGIIINLQAQFRTPICLDESIVSPRHARYALEMKACRIINIKAGRVGGLSQALEIHDLCLCQSIPVWCGGMLETGVGRASNLALASLPGFTLPGDISASDRYYQPGYHQRTLHFES